MKIIDAVYGDATGGRWQAMLNIYDTLTLHGHEVVLVRGQDNAHLSSGDRPITVINSRGFYSVSAALRMRKWLKEQQPDLIIAHSGKAVWLFKNATIGMNIPVIAVNHSHNVKRTVRADAFIHITPHVQYLVQSLQAEKDKSKPQQVISNLMYLPPVEALPQPIRNPPTLAMLTRMVPNKGVHVLIEALGILNSRGIDFKAVLAGQGEMWEAYKELASTLGLNDKISFPGWIGGDDKIALYQQADFIAVPSITDIQPLGILDAFGWGKVVLSSDDVGPLQICQHRVNAWVSKAGDATDMANGIEYLLKHPDEALALAQQAKKEALEKYCFDVIAKKHHEFVLQVAAHYRQAGK